MVVKKILKQLTPERIRKEIEDVNNVKFPAELERWVEEYEKFGGRDVFTWKIFLKAKREINYISIPKKYRGSLKEVYFLLAMFVVLIDDVVDKKRGRELFGELIKIPAGEDYIKINKLNKKNRRYLKFTLKIWRRINRLIKKYPCYNKFKDLFIYDIKQIINAMEYDCLASRDYNLINETELWLYAPHTMRFIIMPSVDLMCFPRFDKKALSTVREITWQALRMMRIGNWVATWEREINDNDFSSGVFACAISKKILAVAELSNANSFKVINKIKKAKIENILLKEWENGYWNILAFKGKIKILNIARFLDGLKKLLIFELISKEYK